MNKELAAKAKEGLAADWSTSQAGMCQRYVRQCIIQTYGQAKYEKYFERYMKASAYETMLAFRKSPYAVPVSRGSVIGDILYKGRKTSGRFGHVGVRVIGNRVCENSSSHIDPENNDHDARGVRSLDAYGSYEMIVRLPEPAELERMEQEARKKKG